MKIKQALIVNLKANMPVGRLSAQICHASELAMAHADVQPLKAEFPEEFSPCTKVVLKGWGDDHLEALHAEAQSLGIPSVLWGEDGFKTALALGPFNKNPIDKVTSGLSLF